MMFRIVWAGTKNFNATNVRIIGATACSVKYPERQQLNFSSNGEFCNSDHEGR
jgi:hypothetical protein